MKSLNATHPISTGRGTVPRFVKKTQDDRGSLILEVKGPWIRAYYEITDAAILRAEAALKALEVKERIKERKRWVPTCIFETNKAAEDAR